MKNVNSLNFFSRSALYMFGYLMYRNILDIKQRLYPLLIDGIFILVINAFLIAKIFPLFQIDIDFLAPFFVADTFLLLLFMQGDTFCARVRLDFINNRFIYYYLTLPIHWAWIFISIGLSFMIELIIISFPLMTVGIYFFSTVVNNVNPHWGLFFMHYIIALLFIITFFLSVLFRHPYSWIENNLWPRRLLPMFCLGATNVTLYQLFSFSPFLGYIALCNPLTYFSEGFRASLLNGHYLPLTISMSFLCISSMINIYFLKKGIIKRLDPV